MLDQVRTAAATAVPLLVSVDGDTPVTWLVFCALNADGFDAGELAAMRDALLRDGVYHGGGGAAGDWTLRSVDPAAGAAAAEAADRLLAAALEASVDLGDATACAVLLTSGPGGDPSLTWDAACAARAAAIRMAQDRMRAAGLDASPATVRAALDEVEGLIWDRPECRAAFDPVRAVLRGLLGLPAEAAPPVH